MGHISSNLHNESRRTNGSICLSGYTQIYLSIYFYIYSYLLWCVKEALPLPIDTRT